MFGSRAFCLMISCTLGLGAGPLQAETAAEWLSRGFSNCDVFYERLASTQLSDEPDFFVCHKYDYKPLYLYGYMRDRGGERFSMTLVKGRKTTCSGQGDLVWRGSGASREASASGRFTCKDGAEGGLAFELETLTANGQSVIGGTIYGGVDENSKAAGAADEEIDADFYIFSGDAVRNILAERGQ